MKRPTYTSASFIKKVFRPGERSLPRNECMDRLQQALQERSFATDDAETMLATMLEQPVSPIRVGKSDAILELTYTPHQVFDLAYRFLRDTHAPKTVEQIIPELRKRTSFSWNQVARMLELERDPRFVQYEGDSRWYLTEWKVANDLLYTFARERQFQQVAVRSVGHILELYLGLMPREYVFLPELDDRFRLEGEVAFLVEPETAADQEGQAPTEAVASVPEPEEALSQVELVFEEAAAETDSKNVTEIEMTREESVMNTTATQQVWQEVNELLKQAVDRLEIRNQEMSEEVVANFQQSNMQAIEALMQEKWKNEKLMQGIQQVLATVGQ